MAGAILDGVQVEAEKAAREILSLPFEPLMTHDVISHVAGTVRKFFK